MTETEFADAVFFVASALYSDTPPEEAAAIVEAARVEVEK